MEFSKTKNRSRNDITESPIVFDTNISRRPPCPDCGSSPIRKGYYWKCTNCGNSWVMNPRPKPDFSNRPDCPVCGKKPQNSFERWRCSCGKSWVKNPKPKIDFSKRPSCDRCGGKPEKKGIRWRCRKCGHTWNKKNEKR